MEILPVLVLTLACGQPTHVGQPVDEGSPIEPPDGTLPLLCEGCASGGDTTDFGGEPPDCTFENRAVSESEATSLGYEVEAFLSEVEGSFSAPVNWSSNDSKTKLTARVTGQGFTLSEREPMGNAECPDLLLVTLRVDLATEDSAVSGRILGDTTLSQGSLSEPLWVSVHASANDLRGKLELDTGDLGAPQGLRAWFNMLVSEGGSPRLGLEISGWYSRDPDSGDEGYAVSFDNAEPSDGCPAFTLPDGGDCVNAPVP